MTPSAGIIAEYLLYLVVFCRAESLPPIQRARLCLDSVSRLHCQLCSRGRPAINCNRKERYHRDIAIVFCGLSRTATECEKAITRAC
ncbi:hypothetical protein OE88DRAFT_415265 [Heliocybe sulcata]|uniref:Secreted protein n=1 Tax=Heliocybe sulcata TaxID=5364 RepID=A0A5C3MV61_9AGAM|nr:hypothetical protein OE88DRAFT_415265 [Heliocybe sulcata]